MSFKILTIIMTIYNHITISEDIGIISNWTNEHRGWYFMNEDLILILVLNWWRIHELHACQLCCLPPVKKSSSSSRLEIKVLRIESCRLKLDNKETYFTCSGGRWLWNCPWRFGYSKALTRFQFSNKSSVGRCVKLSINSPFLNFLAAVAKFVSI